MYCPKCGNFLPSGNVFCEHCNQVVAPIVSPSTYPMRSTEPITRVKPGNNKGLIWVIMGFCLLITVIGIHNFLFNDEKATNKEIQPSILINPQEITVKLEPQLYYNEKGEQKVVVWIKNDSTATFNGQAEVYFYASEEYLNDNLPGDGETFIIKDLQPKKSIWGIMWIKPKYLLSGKYKPVVEGNFDSAPQQVMNAQQIAEEYFKENRSRGKFISTKFLGETEKGEKIEIISSGESGEQYTTFIYVKNNDVSAEYLLYKGREELVWSNPQNR